MSHLASHLDQPDQAIGLARRGRAMLRAGPAHPMLESRLLALEARGYAGRADRDPAGCVELLIRAESILQGPAAEAPSPWVNGYDEASLAGDAARCVRRLGDMAEARRQAERIITLRPGHRTRSRAFGQLALVTALIAQGMPEEACGIALEVVASTHALGSFLVLRQLLDLRSALRPYRTSRVVAEFMTRLEETVRERLWLYEPLVRNRSDYREGT
jgi:hypothetical protein